MSAMTALQRGEALRLGTGQTLSFPLITSLTLRLWKVDQGDGQSVTAAGDEFGTGKAITFGPPSNATAPARASTVILTTTSVTFTGTVNTVVGFYTIDDQAGNRRYAGSLVAPVTSNSAGLITLAAADVTSLTLGS